nr:MAG TPA: hypothetical protein [Caudoviricetes sp.]
MLEIANARATGELLLRRLQVRQGRLLERRKRFSACR